MSWYRIEHGTVMYTHDVKGGKKRVVGADAGSFRSLAPNSCFAGYARDNNAVYYEGAKVPGADPRSFEPIANTYSDHLAWYAKDRARWYGAGAALASRRGGELQILDAGYAIHPEGAFFGARRLEPDGFEVLGRRGYARSRNRAYFRGEEIQGIDAASFSVFPNAHAIARDKRSVVISGRIDGRFDAASFEVLTPDGGFVRDRSHVYWDMKPIAGADPATFVWLGQGYWRDQTSLYFSEKLIAGADPGSFRLLEGRYGVDRLRVYLDGVPLADRDAASFQIIWNGYSRDRNGIYFYDRVLTDVDADSFLVVSEQRARDKFHGFESGKRVCAWTRQAALPMCDAARYGVR